MTGNRVGVWALWLPGDFILTKRVHRKSPIFTKSLPNSFLFNYKVLFVQPGLHPTCRVSEL